jgi:hypothetical protein
MLLKQKASGCKKMSSGCKKVVDVLSRVRTVVLLLVPLRLGSWVIVVAMASNVTFTSSVQVVTLGTLAGTCVVL